MKQAKESRAPAINIVIGLFEMGSGPLILPLVPLDWRGSGVKR